MHRTSCSPIRKGPSSFPRRALTNVHAPAASFLHSLGKVRSLRRSAAQGFTSPQSTPRSRSCAQARGCVRLNHPPHPPSPLPDPDMYVLRIRRYTSSRREKCANLTRTRRTRRQDARDCGASSGACASPSLSHHVAKKYMKHTPLTSCILCHVQRPYLNGDPTSSHDHPHVDNRCVPSSTSPPSPTCL